MTLLRHGAGSAEPDDDVDLTQSIRSLEVPGALAVVDDGADADMYRALLFSRDSGARKWGSRWLSQAGFETELRRDAADALENARAADADVIIVEAALRGSGDAALYSELIGAADLSAPVIVLCNSSREMTAALDAGAWDVVRKPLEWRLVGSRARRAVRAQALIGEAQSARSAAARALELADSARQRLRSREAFEPVTGLPNKTRFIDLIKRGMKAVDRDGNVLAVFVIGFNRFRLVIEAMGQESADLVLTEIGNKINRCLQAAGEVSARTDGLWTAAAASIDGTRFGVMMTCSSDNSDLAEMQQNLLAALSQPVQVASQIVHLSACVGVALYPQDAGDAHRLLQRAENAMRDAQSHGGGFRHYCERSDAAAARKLKMEHMLHEALDRGGITVAYQPITHTATGRLVAAEALLRWPQPDGSFISPTTFAPIAEECGLMIRLGEFVLDEACRQFARWNRKRRRLPLICVNVSKIQLMSGDFVQTVAGVLERHAIEPECLELELSERGVLSGAQDLVSMLHELRRLGVRLSIDDFGTGDSAIAYLKEMPVNSLKIDRSYIGGMVADSKDAAIVSAMVALGQRLDLTVVAEGVEEPEQLAMLRELDCELFQGFIVSRPVPPGKFRKFF